MCWSAVLVAAQELASNMSLQIQESSRHLYRAEWSEDNVRCSTLCSNGLNHDVK